MESDGRSIFWQKLDKFKIQGKTKGENMKRDHECLLCSFFDVSWRKSLPSWIADLTVSSAVVSQNQICRGYDMHWPIWGKDYNEVTLSDDEYREIAGEIRIHLLNFLEKK